MPIYLYVKTHSKTGLKYLGKTTASDPHKYTGSGTRWLNHLKKHGFEYTTEIIRECLSEEELAKWGLYYTQLWNVVNSSKWANLKEEAGQGGSHGLETRQKISNSKKGTTPWNKGKNDIYTEETKKRISEAGKGRRHSEQTKIKMSKADRSLYKRTAPVSDSTKEKLADLLKGKPGRATGAKWTTEQKEAHSRRKMGQTCPTKGKKRVYREDGTFYFK